MSSPSNRLLRNGSIYTFASVASAATALLVTPLLTRRLGLAEYDRVAVAIVVLNIAINILSLGLPVAIIRMVHAETGGRIKARNIAVMGFALVLTAAGLAALVAAIAGQREEIAFALLAGGAGGAAAMVLAFYVATENPRPYVLVSFGLGLGGPAGGLVCVLTLGPQAIHYMTGLAVVYVAIAVSGVLFLPRHAPLKLSGGQLSRALAVGLPMVPHQFAVGSVAGAAVLVEAILLPEGAAAGTQLALLIASAPLTIISALSSALTPIILSASLETRGARLTETSNVIATLAALGGGALAMLAPWFVEFLAPADKFDVAAIVPTVAIASVAPALAVAFTSHLQIVIASGKTLALAYLSPIALAFGIGIGIIVIPWAGVPGAGVMFIAVYLFFLVFARALARKVSPVRWNESSVMIAVLVAFAIATMGALLPWGATVWGVVRLAAAGLLLAGALISFARKILPARA